ncbi:MAG: amidohydrolase, partial [Mycolicibacterium sp.]
MSPATATLYPPEGFGAPKDRHGHAAEGGLTGLPEGTEIFSADNHISVADDIFYERFPEEL